MKTNVLVPVSGSFENFSNFIEELKLVHGFSSFTFLFQYNPNVVDEFLLFFRTSPFFRLENVHLSRNETTLPLIKNTNVLLNECRNAHAIVLKTDARIFPSTLIELVNCHDQNLNAGMISPLSNGWNSGSLFVSTSAIEYELGESIVSRLEAGRVFLTPCVGGPCFFIHKKVIEEIKTFSTWFQSMNEAEIEFSLKVEKNGWENLICSSSFVLDQNPECFLNGSDNFRYLDDNYGLKLNLNNFERHSPFRLYKMSVLFSTLMSGKMPSVLFVCHAPIYSNTSGGTERHVKDLIGINNFSTVCFFMYPLPGNLFSFGAAFKSVFFEVTLAEIEIVSVLQETNNSFDVIHIHHLMNLPKSLIELIISSESKKFFSVHDYFLACPTINMLKSDTGKFCQAEIDNNKCELCINRTIHKGVDIAAYRQSSNTFLESIDELYFPSVNVKNYFNRALEFSGPELIKHHSLGYLSPFHLKTPYRPFANRIVLLGAIGKHKGSRFIDSIYNQLIKKNYEVEVWGEIDSKKLKNKIKIRKYHSPEQLKSLFATYCPEFVLMPSEAAETYSYTFYETLFLSNAIPIVGPFGNPADVCKNHKVGLILEQDNWDFFEELMDKADKKSIVQAIEKYRAILVQSIPANFTYPIRKDKKIGTISLDTEVYLDDFQLKDKVKYLLFANHNYYLLSIRMYQTINKLIHMFKKLKYN